MPTPSQDGNAAAIAAEKKRKRLEAWKRKREKSAGVKPAPAPAPAVKVSLSLGGKSSISQKKKKKKKKGDAFGTNDKKTASGINPFGADDADGDDGGEGRKSRLSVGLASFDMEPPAQTKPAKKKRRRRGWDSGTKKSADPTPAPAPVPQGDDALDAFMQELEAGAHGNVTSQVGSARPASSSKHNDNGNSMEVDGGETGVSEEEEEKQRRAFIEALKSAAPTPTTAAAAATAPSSSMSTAGSTGEAEQPQLAAEVRNEKQRRGERLKALEREAEQARNSAKAAAASEFGRMFNDVEDGIMEEAEQKLDAAKAAPDALQVLAELNKKKELKAVDHSTIDYIPFKKNLYIMPRSLASLSNNQVTNIRGKMKIRVRGQGVPAPVSSFEQCGLSERIVQLLNKQEISQPYPVQAQCIPCILAGRDTIGIAKTGSGKTLAYLLPMLRHIADQPKLASNESGPVGLILAPARELAYQINLVSKSYTKHLGLKTTAVYGGAAVAEQISDLKRGVHVCVATPGRLIDILTMQAGKLLSLHRVTYVVMDEADRMYDMGFAPQITAILAAVRPDRQTVLFSATFPKAVETLARKSLKFPVEVIVGGRSVASDSITQHAELVEEGDKFLRLLQLLGEHVDDAKKALVFVDTQVRADSLFEQLLGHGYPSLSLHGGKDQEDRDSTISDFKRKDGPGVLVATSVAGRGLDVPSIGTVINYSCPNHLEDYVHRVGRTGRAGRKGTSYTFVNSAEEAKYSPNIVRALSEAGQADNIDAELLKLSEEFKEKVKKGEAKWASSGFKGKGYTYDSSEMNEAQRAIHMEKRQALIEAGLLDPEDEEDPMGAADGPGGSNANAGGTNKVNSVDEANAMIAKALESENGDKDAKKEAKKALGLQTEITAKMLALPGMKDMLLKRAGVVKDADAKANSANHNGEHGGGFAGSSKSSRPVRMGNNHFLVEYEINDYPREARWKVTQKETTSRLQDEFQTAVTLKGEYFAPNRQPGKRERKLYLHLEATSELILKNCVAEIHRLLNEETLRVSARSGGGSHKYNVLG